jgi:uncharacterized protein involved in exopolysaccharide biosynthesis
MNSVDYLFEELAKMMSFPRMGDIKRYKVVPMTDNDILEEEIKALEDRIARKKGYINILNKEMAELEEKLQKQKKRLNP